MICDFETSRFNEHGRRRARFGLAIIGRQPAETVVFPGTWLLVPRRDRALTGGAASIHPIAGEFMSTMARHRTVGRLPLAGWTFNNKPEWSQPERISDQHGLYESRHGRGRVRYLPFGAGKLFHLTGSPATGALLRRIVSI